MQEVILTCVACGKTKVVADTPDAMRDRHCPECGESMVLDRQPGSVLDGAPTP